MSGALQSTPSSLKADPVPPHGHKSPMKSVGKAT